MKTLTVSDMRDMGIVTHEEAPSSVVIYDAGSQVDDDPCSDDDACECVHCEDLARDVSRRVQNALLEGIAIGLLIMWILR